MAKFMKSAIFIAGYLISASMLQAQNQILDLMDRLNVITGNYTAGNETEGSAFVYGTYLPQGALARFGFNGGAVADDQTNVLWLNNGVGNANTTTLISGSVISRTPVDAAQFVLNGNGAGTPTVNQGTSLWDAALTTLGVGSVSELTSTLTSASSQWAGLTPFSTGGTPGNGSFTINAIPTSIDGHQVAVYNTSASALFGSGFDRLEAAGMDGVETLLINVSGTSVTVDKNFTNGFTNNEFKILFNFYEATALTISANFRGTIYAPLASVTQAGSNIDGSVVSASLSQTAEVHDAQFNGYLPYTAVPEPGAASLLALLTGSLLFRRCRTA